jgi:hypothetical protein
VLSLHVDGVGENVPARCPRYFFRQRIRKPIAMKATKTQMNGSNRRKSMADAGANPAPWA